MSNKRRLTIFRFFSRLFKEKPLGAAGAVITLLLLLTGIFAGALAPHGYNDIDTDHFLEAPSAQYPLGTDNLGRDNLSRIIYGARISMIVGLAATGISTIVGLAIGILCGYIGGTFDLVIQRLVDAVMSIPGMILLMAIISILGPGMWQVVIVLGLRWGITGSRLSRSAVIRIREDLYVHAAKAVGCTTYRTLLRHILPNIMAPVIIGFTTTLPGIILTEASLSFLGYGIPPPMPSWGGMLSGSARTYMFQAPWMALWPGLALSVVVYGINMFGDAVRDLLDPRMRGGGGRFGLDSKKLSKLTKGYAAKVQKSLSRELTGAGDFKE
jgi:peptide/nickel transport system permease protein